MHCGPVRTFSQDDQQRSTNDSLKESLTDARLEAATVRLFICAVCTTVELRIRQRLSNATFAGKNRYLLLQFSSVNVHCCETAFFRREEDAIRVHYDCVTLSVSQVVPRRRAAVAVWMLRSRRSRTAAAEVAAVLAAARCRIITVRRTRATARLVCRHRLTILWFLTIRRATTGIFLNVRLQISNEKVVNE